MKNKIPKFLHWTNGRSKKTVLISCLITAAVVILLATALMPVNSGRKGADGKPVKTTLLGRLLGTDKPDSKHAGSTALRSEELTRSVKRIDRLYEKVDKDAERGELAADKAKLVKQKLDETKEFLDSIANRPKAEQEDLINEKQAELRNWARENDIRLSYVRM